MVNIGRIGRVGRLGAVGGGGGVVLSPAAAMLADYDDGLAWVAESQSLAIKVGGSLTYDGDLLTHPDMTVTGTPVFSGDYVVTSGANRFSLLLSAFPSGFNTAHTIVSWVYGGYGGYQSWAAFTGAGASPYMGANVNGTRAWLFSSGGSPDNVSATPTTAVSNTAQVFRVGYSFEQAVAARCLVNGGAQAQDTTVNCNFAFDRISWGSNAIGTGSARTQKWLCLPTASSLAQLQALTA
jgi:hypothetical protein